MRSCTIEKYVEGLSPEDAELARQALKNPATGVIQWASVGNFLNILWRNSKSLKSSMNLPRVITSLINRTSLAVFRILDEWDKPNIEKVDLKDVWKVFVLGNFRSWTTTLHENMTKAMDNTVYPSGIQVTCPDSFIHSSKVMKFMSKFLASKERPLDKMPIDPDLSPQETQFAMMNLLDFETATEWFLFPDSLNEKLDLIDLEKYPEDLQKKYREEYEFFLKKMVYKSRLDWKTDWQENIVIKNPPDTWNLPFLLDLFPDGKFINIVRNPYKVIQSSINASRSMMMSLQLQNKSYQELTEIATEASFKTYKTLIGNYLKQRKSIPEWQLVEIKFEDFVKDRKGMTKEICESLWIDIAKDFDEDKWKYNSYLDSIKSYKKNEFSDMSPDLIKRINWELAFAFEAFWYEMI